MSTEAIRSISGREYRNSLSSAMAAKDFALKMTSCSKKIRFFRRCSRPDQRRQHRGISPALDNDIFLVDRPEVF